MRIRSACLYAAAVRDSTTLELRSALELDESVAPRVALLVLDDLHGLDVAVAPESLL